MTDNDLKAVTRSILADIEQNGTVTATLKVHGGRAAMSGNAHERIASLAGAIMGALEGLGEDGTRRVIEQGTALVGQLKPLRSIRTWTLERSGSERHFRLRSVAIRGFRFTFPRS